MPLVALGWDSVDAVEAAHLAGLLRALRWLFISLLPLGLSTAGHRLLLHLLQLPAGDGGRALEVPDAPVHLRPNAVGVAAGAGAVGVGAGGFAVADAGRLEPVVEAAAAVHLEFYSC